MSLRTEQVASLLQRTIQQVFSRGLNDPRVRGLISITRVSVAPDLSDATVYVSILPEEHVSVTMHGIRSAGPYIRSRLREMVSLRRVPRLSFKLDRSLKNESEVQAAIARAQERGEDRSADGPDTVPQTKEPAS